MKEIKAYGCDHCKKIAKTKQTIKNHESRCFKNPATKSCITCSNFVIEDSIHGMLLTESENNAFLDYIKTGVLDDDYAYLEEMDSDNYCLAIKEFISNNLRTQCQFHK